ncbi:VOC family protein [Mycobacterium deserti]|uniref:Glyoxalase-like domain-containing protein n=1 Tax=Mycobacterium deserti TaxID=2978347 RepID=A0ABT2MDW0_9MYCO|nr:VOC family protein [Mycobacterium deserti]MCT7660449.1 hypothetical protein [Mycobacterium deserti]
MTLRLGPLVVDSVNPGAMARFWTAALGVGAARQLLTFRPESRPKTVKNRVHLDLYVRDTAPLLELGARILSEHSGWVTLADVEGNEFCAFPNPAAAPDPPAEAFAVCTDSARPEELAAWWARQVGADVRNGPDGTPRWLYGAAGWEQLIWKFVRVEDERVAPNRWQWTVDSGAGVDPQRNEFSGVPPARRTG